MKQMPVESFLAWFGSPASAARRRTSAFFRSPTGNMTRSRSSAAKFTASSGTPITSAAAAASIRSWRVEQCSSSSSSSQFFMNRPTTSWPARFSSSAATDESTPPDMPTTTFSRIALGQDLERKAPPGEEVLDALLHQRRAVLGAPRGELGRRQPGERDDLLVEPSALLHAVDPAAERKAQERHVLLVVAPAVDAEQCRGREAMRRLLQHLARHRLGERLARIEVPGRLVQHAPPVRHLLDEQKAPVALDHRRDGDAGSPAGHAALLVFFLMNSAMRATPCSIAGFEAA